LVLARTNPSKLKPALKTPQAEQVAEKVVRFVIPSEARNLSLIEIQKKRDSSARSVPRNDKNLDFSAACEACAT
jgi:hypothetical protein